MSLIGLPQINGVTNPSNLLSTGLTLLQGAAWSALTAEVKWGIYQNGKEVVLTQSQPSIFQKAAQSVGLNDLIDLEVKFDSVVEMAHRKHAEVSNYRIETGSFKSFNKVETPRHIPIRLAKGGDEFGRQAFLIWLENNVKAPTLFDIYVPEVNYLGLTLADYNYRRVSSDGVDLIIADCLFQEVLQATFKRSTSDTTNAQNPQDKPTQSMTGIAQNEPSPTALSRLQKAVGL